MNLNHGNTAFSRMTSRISLKLVILFAFSAAVATLLAQAQDGVFQKFDKNADGKVTTDELPYPRVFARFDSNKDGSITKAEYLAVNGGAPQSPAITPADLQQVSSGPELLHPGDAGIGRMMQDMDIITLDGQHRRLADLQGKSGLVIVMTSATCPVSKRYIPSIAKLENELAAWEIGLLLVNPFASEKSEEIRAQLSAGGIRAAYIHDKDKKLSMLLQARTTTEVFLLDSKRTLIYRGALDDQYGINYNLAAPRQHYLHEAIHAWRKQQKPAIQATAAPGCELDLVKEQKPVASPVTYYRDVARILQQNCVTCHRDGGIAPFTLDDPEEVQDRARVIKRVVTEGTMPPWFAAAENVPANNPWANDCSLSMRDKADLLAWLDSSDRPLGDPAEAPARHTYPAEWSIGTPDLIIPLSRAYDIKADGYMPYAFDVVDTSIAEDKWVSAYEILPSERDVVHHVIVQVYPKGAVTRNRGEGAEGYWAAYVPGNGATVYPPGFARKIPAGARVTFQIHYTPSGKAKQERLRMGLVFAKSAPQFEVRTAAIANPRLAIPPGAERHVETKSQTVPFDMPILGFVPHMHVRGAAFRYEVIHADGRAETLLDIPRYDFNWQLRYEYKKPKLIPRGSTVKITAVFNNSASNKANPDPSKLVRWGQQTYDEMMLGYVEYFTPVGGNLSQ